METSGEQKLPFHLTGAFAPVGEERTERELPFTGRIPLELRGTFVRNGPNPRTGWSPAWFAGEGMLHGIRIEAGRAAWYKCRWIKGPRAPNTSIVRHAGRVLTLVETSLPVEVTPELETIAPYDFDGAVMGSMTAHPKTCPRTGELIFFSTSRTPPYLTYFRADAAGRVIHRTVIELAAPAFMHDFAITERYTIFYVPPVRVGDFRSPVPLQWLEQVPTRFAILPRAGGAETVRWFEVAPCSITHIVNAFESDGRVVVDAVSGPRIMASHSWRRYRFDLGSGRATESEVDSRFVDFPRVHPAFVGVRQRYAYTVELRDFGADGSFTKTIARQHDLERGTATAQDFGAGSMPGEGVVAPRPGFASEQDAWILQLVHRKEGAETALVILNAADYEAPPVASIRIPGRVPYGLHAEWLPDLA
ncbi:MAG TPA: carotenoid oxygenase family protein [Polyangiaceae bacterium]|nr:carotenoid oxygenase family protein [Polyangiaceae bacterium]